MTITGPILGAEAPCIHYDTHTAYHSASSRRPRATPDVSVTIFQGEEQVHPVVKSLATVNCYPRDRVILLGTNLETLELLNDKLGSWKLSTNLFASESWIN